MGQIVEGQSGAVHPRGDLGLELVFLADLEGWCEVATKRLHCSSDHLAYEPHVVTPSRHVRQSLRTDLLGAATAIHNVLRNDGPRLDRDLFRASLVLEVMAFCKCDHLLHVKASTSLRQRDNHQFCRLIQAIGKLLAGGTK